MKKIQFSNIIDMYITHNGLKQDAAAAMLGVSRMTLYKARRGRMSRHTYVKIASKLFDNKKDTAIFMIQNMFIPSEFEQLAFTSPHEILVALQNLEDENNILTL
jgi:predicted XRE-type DNA-binding protein